MSQFEQKINKDCPNPVALSKKKPFFYRLSHRAITKLDRLHTRPVTQRFRYVLQQQQQELKQEQEQERKFSLYD